MSPLLWAAIGVVLTALELIVPGLFLLWFGGAALVTGLIIGFEGNLGLVREVALFTVLSGCSIGIAIALARWRGPRHAANGINDRAGQLVGLQATLSDPIAGGRGRIFVGDTLWQVQGPDLPAGTAIVIAGHTGMVLTVQAAEAPSAGPAAPAAAESP